MSLWALTRQAAREAIRDYFAPVVWLWRKVRRTDSATAAKGGSDDIPNP